MGGSVIVIFAEVGSAVAVVKATVTTAVETCMGFMSAVAMTIDTPDTAATDPDKPGIDPEAVEGDGTLKSPSFRNNEVK